MKYMLMFTDAEGAEDAPGAEAEAVMERVGAWWAEHSRSGEILSGERLQPQSRATTVRFGGSGATVVDGPFAETKEAIGGYAIAEVADLDAAIRLVKSWPASPSVEIRPVWED